MGGDPSWGRVARCLASVREHANAGVKSVGGDERVVTASEDTPV